MNHGLHAREGDLGQLVLRGEQSLLRLQHGQQVGGALTVLKLGDLKGFPRRIDFASKVRFRFRLLCFTWPSALSTSA